MFVLLLMLLVFALIVTMIGFFLSTKSEVRIQQPEFVVARRGSHVIDSVPMGRERMLEPVPSTRSRIVDPVPFARRSVVDAVPSSRRYIDRPLPVARRRPVESVPVRSSQLSVGGEIRTADIFQLQRYLNTSGGVAPESRYPCL